MPGKNKEEMSKMPDEPIIVAPATEAVVADPAPATTIDPPVVPAADPAEPAPAPAPVTDEPDPSTEPAPEKPSKVVAELIAQRKKRQDAEREAAYWRGQAEARGAEKVPPMDVQSASPSAPVAPKLDQFETFEQYEAAKDKYLIAQAKHEFLQEQTATNQRQAAMTVDQAFQKRINEAAKEDPAIVDVMRDPTLPISSSMIPLLKESENAPKILRWLDQNRAEASRIATLPPLQAAREMGIIEAQIRFAPKVEPPRRVSAAPEPVKPVVPSSVSIVDEESLSMEEYHRRQTEKLLKTMRR